MEKRFQRPISDYTGSEDLLYRDKYQKDSKSVPKIAISSSKMDGDFNYLVDAVNTLDEDIKSVVHNGIANSTIETEHLIDGSITGAKIVDNSITSAHLTAGSVTNAKVADLSITTPKIANNSVTLDKMATDSIGTDEVIDGSITKDKLASDVIMDSIPVGTITQFSVDVLPAGWLECNGSTISKDTYPKLVRFLTNSDIEITATLPCIPAVTKDVNGQMQIVAKSAIKAFSDSPELANLEIAGLTQDVSANTTKIETNRLDITNRGLKRFEPLAEVFVIESLASDYSYNVKSVTRIDRGVTRINLGDNAKGVRFFALITTERNRIASVQYTDWAEGFIEIRLFEPNEVTQDSSFFARIFKVQE